MMMHGDRVTDRWGENSIVGYRLTVLPSILPVKLKIGPPSLVKVMVAIL